MEIMANQTIGSTTVIKKQRTSMLISAIVAAAVVAAAATWGNRARSEEYITGKVERGNVDVIVSATGTVQAVTTVEIGSQVSGTVSWLGADFKSQVKRGQVIAKLDSPLLKWTGSHGKIFLPRSPRAFREPLRPSNHRSQDKAFC